MVDSSFQFLMMLNFRLTTPIVKALSKSCRDLALKAPKIPRSDGLGLAGGFIVEGLRIGSFRKLGVPFLGVLIIRILLFRVLY